MFDDTLQVTPPSVTPEQARQPAVFRKRANAEPDWRANGVRDVIPAAQPVGCHSPDDDDGHAEYEAAEQAADRVNGPALQDRVLGGGGSVEHLAALHHFLRDQPRARQGHGRVLPYQNQRDARLRTLRPQAAELALLSGRAGLSRYLVELADNRVEVLLGLADLLGKLGLRCP